MSRKAVIPGLTALPPFCDALKRGVVLAALDARRPTRDIDLAASALREVAEIHEVIERLYQGLPDGDR